MPHDEAAARAAAIAEYQHNRLLEFVRQTTFGQGSFGLECRICLQTDYSGQLTHLPWCAAVRDRIRHELGDGPH